MSRLDNQLCPHTSSRKETNDFVQNNSATGSSTYPQILKREYHLILDPLYAAHCIVSCHAVSIIQVQLYYFGILPSINQTSTLIILVQTLDRSWGSTLYLRSIVSRGFLSFQTLLFFEQGLKTSFVSMIHRKYT